MKLFPYLTRETAIKSIKIIKAAGDSSFDINNYRYSKKKYSQEFKDQVVREANELNNNSFIAKKYKLDESNVRSWRKKYTPEINLKISKKRKRSNQRDDRILQIESEVKDWIIRMRSKKLGISFVDMQKKALEIAKKNNVPESLFKASNGWMCRFKKRQRLSLRCSTHQASKLKENASEQIKTFLDTMKKLKIEQITSSLFGAYTTKYVYLNLDEVPFPLDLSRNRTVDFTGNKTIEIIKNNKSEARITLLLAIDSEGNFAKPFLITRGKEQGITDDFNNNVFISQNKTAWITTELFLLYLKAIIPIYRKKYERSKCKFIIIMDDFSVHKDQRVLKYLDSQKVAYYYIPPGCTGLLQPLDVCINKPYKDALRKLYNKWLELEVNQIGETEKLKAPGNDTIVSWINQVNTTFNPELIKISFKKCGINIDHTEKHIISERLANQENLQDYFSELNHNELDLKYKL